jgi:tellurite methyltransferase
MLNRVFKDRPTLPPRMDLQHEFGEIDVYLFDQLVKGRITPGKKILDAGCGSGRNLRFLLRQGYSVWGVDRSLAHIARVRALAREHAPLTPSQNFHVEELEHLSFLDGFFDVVICNAVLHFASDQAHFDRMLNELWRVLASDGVLFVRTASALGQDVSPLPDGRVRLPDGSERFVVDEPALRQRTLDLDATLLDAIKTVHVPNARSMVTWCLAKTS